MDPRVDGRCRWGGSAHVLSLRIRYRKARPRQAQYGAGPESVRSHRRTRRSALGRGGRLEPHS
eukprot:13128029-Heterocapsa_arctica.AAC.1